MFGVFYAGLKGFTEIWKVILASTELILLLSTGGRYIVKDKSLL